MKKYVDTTKWKIGSKKTYTSSVKRAAAHDGSVEELPKDTTDKPSYTQTNIPSTGKTGLAWW